MRLIATLLFLLGDCLGAGCSKPVPAPPATGDVRVYLQLVECGALGANDGGAEAVAQERQIGDMPFLGCMYDGGTAMSCGAPCGDR